MNQRELYIATQFLSTAITPALYKLELLMFKSFLLRSLTNNMSLVLKRYDYRMKFEVCRSESTKVKLAKIVFFYRM